MLEQVAGNPKNFTGQFLGGLLRDKHQMKKKKLP
jgi:hypothetical protein